MNSTRTNKSPKKKPDTDFKLYRPEEDSSQKKMSKITGIRLESNHWPATWWEEKKARQQLDDKIFKISSFILPVSINYH